MLALLAACRGEGAHAPSGASLDDLGDTIAVGAPATRIVSLSPVTTEILFAIGAGKRVVGRTHFDQYPAEARTVTDLGDGMEPNVEAILGVRPDLVVLYGSAANRPAAQRLRGAGVRTIAIRTDHVADFRRVVTILARAVGDSAAGVVVADSVERSLEFVARLPRPAHQPTVFWHVWDAPLITIGRGSYLSELVAIAGGRNVFDDLADPSPQVTMEEVVRRDPDFVIVGAVSATKLRANAAWSVVPAVRAGRILVTDTALVGRPGVRMGEAARQLRSLLVPAVPR